MRILIVGCGYVGIPLGAELVRRGHEVFGLSRNANSKSELVAQGINPLQCDITRADDLRKFEARFDWIVNCVASGGGGADEYRRVYLDGTRNLIAWLAGAPLRKFLYTSSTSVYGQQDGSFVTELSPATPGAGTAKILIETENVLLDAARRNGFPAVILRVAGIYGPGRGYWFKQFARNEACIEGQGERFLNMIHRDDVFGCVLAGLERGRPGEIYNAVDDEPVTHFEFFEWLARQFNRPMPPSTEGNPMVQRRGLTNKRVSNHKLKTELGYHFKYPTFREGYSAEIQRLKAAERD